MSDRPRRDRYRFPETRDSRIAMVATLAIFLVVMLIFIVLIFRQGTLTIATPTPQGAGAHGQTTVVTSGSLPLVLSF